MVSASKDNVMEDATWKGEFALKSQFPDLSIEDKVVLPAMGVLEQYW